MTDNATEAEAPEEILQATPINYMGVFTGKADAPCILVLQESDTGRSQVFSMTPDQLVTALRLGLERLGHGHGLADPVVAKKLPELVAALGRIEDNLLGLINAIPNYEDLNGYIDRLAERLSQSR